MSHTADDQIRRILISKFDHFEGEVDANAWNKIAEAIGAAQPAKRTRRGGYLRLLSLLFLLGATALGLYSLAEGDQGAVELNKATINTTSTEEEVTDLGEREVSIRSTESKSVQPAESKSTQVAESQPAQPAEGKYIEPTESIKVLEANQQGLGDTQAEAIDSEIVKTTPPEVNSRPDQSATESDASVNTSDNIIEGQEPLPLLLAARNDETSQGQPELFLGKNLALERDLAVPQTLELFEDLFPQTALKPFEPQGGVASPGRTKRFLMRFNFGVTMNYLIVSPNDNDDILFKRISSRVDLSSRHLGLRAGYDLWWHIDSRFWFKNQIYLNGRQHDVTFEFDPSALPTGIDSDQVNLSWNELSLGLSAGIIYQLSNTDVTKLSVDLGIGIEQLIADGLGDNALASFPKQVWNVNMGLTFSPRTGGNFQWLVRPFVYYGLNKNFSDKASELKPYGFGLQLIRH